MRSNQRACRELCPRQLRFAYLAGCRGRRESAGWYCPSGHFVELVCLPRRQARCRPKSCGRPVDSRPRFGGPVDTPSSSSRCAEALRHCHRQPGLGKLRPECPNWRRGPSTLPMVAMPPADVLAPNREWHRSARLAACSNPELKPTSAESHPRPGNGQPTVAPAAALRNLHLWKARQRLVSTRRAGQVAGLPEPGRVPPALVVEPANRARPAQKPHRRRACPADWRPPNGAWYEERFHWSQVDCRPHGPLANPKPHRTEPPPAARKPTKS